MKKTAIVTGGSRGIGYAITRQLGLDGGQVVIFSTSEKARYEEALRELEDLGISYHYVRGSIDKSEDRVRLVEEAIGCYGRIDILVNNAGVAPLKRSDLLEMTEESFDTVMGINLRGTMFLTQAAARAMLRNEPEGGVRGYICNISSVSAYTASVNRGEYCVSKAGVSMLTELFAARLAGEGILVNEVRPGIIATDMTGPVREKYDRMIEGGLLPLKRWGKPEDVADAVYVLCSGALPYVTGQVLDVDGGFHIRRL